MFLANETLRFYAFQHPYVCTFVKQLRKDGVPALLTLENQRLDNDAFIALFSAIGGSKKLTGFFDDHYKPNDAVVQEPHPTYNVDFDRGGAYSQYNWELFFHIPLFVATRLMQDERHDEAMQYLHYIFNPTTASTDAVPQRYWFCKPLRDEGKPQTITKLLQSLKPGGPPASGLAEAINEWRDHPFEPHRVARRRPGAYQKTVVMTYLDNLIAWGDKLFRRDTIESINEATQLYVLAARILGKRPHRVPELTTPVPQTYADLRPGLDAFSNAVVQIETMAQPFTPGAVKNLKTGAEMMLGLGTQYFCIPNNERLLAYWDTVGDRLFKIRNCMNIEGVVRDLALFEPPIDPLLLVRARAMGLDLATVLDELNAPLPHYRFTFMLQKAREFCEELKQLAGVLLSALEKKDAEELAHKRTGHEKALLDAIRDVKKQHIKEAEQALAGLEEARLQASIRQQFYSSRAYMIAGEKTQLDMMLLASGLQTAAQVVHLGASFAHAWPDQFIGAMAGTGGGAIHLSRVAGGSSTGSAMQAGGRVLEMLSGAAQTAGSASGILAGYHRRAEEWKLQADIAAADIKQLDKQIAAADIRRQIAERELSNQELQIEQVKEVDEYFRDKFTSRELYGWMCSQVSAVYFQAYRVAYDIAKRAERAYRTELAVEQSSFIRFGAWDNLRSGLLAGERLSLDLRRLEAAYLDQNKRTYELTKHVSLAQLDPEALIRLKETGRCDVSIPEELFDLDYPGHYLRRIKSVSLTIPSVTGPYTTVSGTLTLLKHETRGTPTDDPLDESFSLVQSIAISGGRNDAGIFEMNFRDERRLPFEGAGAVSRWHLELPTKVRQFDYDTISDVVFHINYTALEGGGVFAAKRQESLVNRLNQLTGVAGTTGLFRAISLRHEFPNDWHRLRQGQPVSLTLGRDRFPYFASAMKKLKIEAVEWLARTGATEIKPVISIDPLGTGASSPIDWAPDQSTGLFRGTTQASVPLIELDKSFLLTSASGDNLTALWAIVRYSVSDK